MKYMAPYERRILTLLIGGFGLILMVAGRFTESMVLMAIGAVPLFAALGINAIFYRCPHCHRHLRHSIGDYCPYCGENVNIP